MRHKENKFQNNYAISDVVGLIMTLIIVTATISTITLWYTPYMDDQKAIVRSDSAESQFETLDDVLQDILKMGKGSSRYINFFTDKGTLSLNSRGNRIIIYYSYNPNFDINFWGMDDDIDFQFEITSSGGHATSDFSMTIYYLYQNTKTPPSGALVPGVVHSFSNSTGPIHDAVMIEFTVSTLIVGRLWLFDLGNIQFKTTSTSNEYTITTENEGIIKTSYGSSYLINEPKTLSQDENIILTIVKLIPKTEKSISDGSGYYKIYYKHNDTNITENKGYIPSNKEIKIQVIGDQSGPWGKYLESQDFIFVPELVRDPYYALDGDKYFTLIFSQCDVDIEVIS